MPAAPPRRRPPKTQQLQIRVSPQQKATLRKLARAAGRDLSSYVLSRLIPEGTDRYAEILGALREAEEPRFALAELNDFLHAATPSAFVGAVSASPPEGLSPFLRNYVTAMVELASHRKRVPPPAWVGAVAPLDRPHFATAIPSLRLHLLEASPVPFKRRNIFIDASLGDRV